ncbi:beta-ketoacyl synthase N-terminal-like domain-containing protein [Apibacter raozihei]|uniref:beta-ketoacyl synthase N-terminal-like domain-containing protein n=1 Tax=Apibacter raozihei TaxID=2500547 RepID=UPI000FE37D5E|nr:beta-ketoacyl synthase N-terminal-like domain-containing protein [Apibacter raozihei]
MEDVFITGDHIISPLGNTSLENFSRIMHNESGIQLHHSPDIHETSFYSSLIDEETVSEIKKRIKNSDKFTRLENLIIYSIQTLIESNSIPLDDKTLLILSSTKGNISLQGRNTQFPGERVYLSVMGQVIQDYFKHRNSVVIISNACISGSLAISVARDLLQSPQYERAIVIGADEISKFIFSGFSSFQAVSPEPCRPFDSDRSGVTLGEAVASVYLSKKPKEGAFLIEGVGSFNDANHISGPSRTGEGLYRSIEQAFKDSENPDPGFISAHGTATLYNDEMESIAFGRANLLDIPVNSFKGYYGHTLGASGILETILSIHSLHNQMLIKSMGYFQQGTSQALNIIKENSESNIKSFLKTASGFGGSNIATLFTKYNS